MIVKCHCGNEFDITDTGYGPNYQREYSSPYRFPCPNCRRSYELSVKLLPENPNFWDDIQFIEGRKK